MKSVEHERIRFNTGGRIVGLGEAGPATCRTRGGKECVLRGDFFTTEKQFLGGAKQGAAFSIGVNRGETEEETIIR